MARYQIAIAAAEPVRPYLEGVAKSLVDRLYGDKGPAWGTKLTEIEDTIKAIRQVLSETMLDDALQRQAKYRRQGLPITSSYVELAVKQFNQRVKGPEKFWTVQGSEALLQLRADYLSPTSVLDDFWQARQDHATGQNQYAQVM